MIKLLGCLMIASSCLFVGLDYIKNLRVRVRGITAMIELLSTLKIKINYEHSVLPKLLRELRQKCAYPNTVFLDECILNLDSGKDFKDAWILAAETYSNQMQLSKTDTEILKGVSIGLGDSDVSGQISNIQLYTEMLEKNLLESEKTLKEKTKVTLSCSLFGSLVVLVLLI